MNLRPFSIHAVIPAAAFALAVTAASFLSSCRASLRRVFPAPPPVRAPAAFSSSFSSAPPPGPAVVFRDRPVYPRLPGEDQRGVYLPGVVDSAFTGRRVDGEGVMHEGHAVYRLSHAPAWNLGAQEQSPPPTGVMPGLRPENFAPVPHDPAADAALAREREVLRLEREAAGLSPGASAPAPSAPAVPSTPSAP